MSDQTEVLRAWRAEMLEQWKDNRSITSAEVDVLLRFFYHAYADEVKTGATLRGFSFRLKEDDCLLVVKVTRDGVPEVVFVSSSSPMGCMRKWLRMIDSGDIKYLPDRYA